MTYGTYIEYGTPAHIMPSWAYVMFDFDNHALNTTVHCYIASTYPYNWFLDGKEWFNCSSAEYSPTRFRLEAQWLGSPTRLDIENRWRCWEDENTTTLFSGLAAFLPPLACHAVGWRNPDWELWQTHRSNKTLCNSVTVDVRPYEVKVIN
ncbi:hypothetical protein QBC34DRAFT_475965 [Podospora aff. communis PSN243]|uniref:Uncharacterized protein n=1 Tax=Podospora aff. communis PSN243 TaxID=3040156 RepID=A0AAV9G9C3_9PEZI|nr:hypothetical protein QBC34DRAFT_475965 [Podospora aff. communis PSN243]